MARMSEEKEAVVDKGDGDDNVTLVSMHKRVPELEERVAYYMSTVDETFKKVGMKPFEINTVKYTRVKIPNFKGDKQKKIWEETEIDRCVNGHNGMSGKMYFFFNYCWMKNIEKGKLAPEYRVCDNEWFSLETAVQTEGRGEGIVCVKRRRVGMSWKASASVVHDSILIPFHVTGMNSKSVVDSQILFNKVKFIFDNLPPFLKIRVRSKTKNYLDFAWDDKDELGNTVKKGTQSEIICVAPTVSAYEGQMLNKLVIDEAGLQPELPSMWGATEPCLSVETKRLGVPILFGTSGDVGTVGMGLKEMWDNHDVYNLRRFFFTGYMGLFVDELGNDRIEETIRWIVYERKRRMGLSTKQYHEFLQRYPLSLGDAFSLHSEGGVGNIVKLMAQKDELATNPPKSTTGFMKINKDLKPVFVPNIEDGYVTIYEHAKDGIDDGYWAAIDPVSTDDAYKGSSDLAMYVMKRPLGTTPARIVASYVGRPKEVNDAYQQCVLMLQYYGDTRALIENNRYRMVSYFNDNGLKHLLQTAPRGITTLVGGKSNQIGITMTKAVKTYIAELMEEYIDDYSTWIPDPKLIDEFFDWGVANTDRAIAFGLCLILSKEDRTVPTKKGAIDINIPRYGYRRDSSGRITLVNN